MTMKALRRILYFLVRGPKTIKLSSSIVAEISEELLSLKSLIPHEFARKPRPLSSFDRWKATELRLFLLYTGPLVLKKHLKSDMYSHFMCLSVATSILLTKTDINYTNFARNLLRLFVRNCKFIYGESFTVYNVHNLIHIADDVQNHSRTLNEMSCFPFENYLFKLKKNVKSPVNPAVQVAKRWQYLDHSLLPDETKTAEPEGNMLHHRNQCYMTCGDKVYFVDHVHDNA
jgi:hypothetical protein